MDDKSHMIVVGAGIAGLAAALRLSHAGHAVTVLDQNAGPGGKMRTFPSTAGPVDAGPTVLTMRPVFEALFSDVGERLSDHLNLRPLETLARHYWDDGTSLDLVADPGQSTANVQAAFGAKAARQFTAFSDRARRLFEAFDAPMMQSAAPSQLTLTQQVARNPRLIMDMAPWRSLAGLLKQQFDDPRLAQLFGRYATYVGGSPFASPAILSLIWHAEASGVWAVKGGMHQLAKTLMQLAEARGAVFHFDTPVRRITQQGGKISGVETARGQWLADVVLFNGDPRALARGLLGQTGRQAVAPAACEPRSLSAYVHAFAAAPSGLPLAHHTVFFGHDPKAEFNAIKRGQMPRDATLYLCAQDHGQVDATANQRFEIIMNAPAVPRDPDEEIQTCQTQVFSRLKTMGLTFSPTPQPETLTTPAGFQALCPGSEGALYGTSPHGLMAAFKRPTARTRIPGLYLCGGGVHPGAGVPMATLSAAHAAAAILTDRTSILTSRQTVTPGGMSTASAATGARRSPS